MQCFVNKQSINKPHFQTQTCKTECSFSSINTIWVWLGVISLYSSQSQVQREEDRAEWGQLQKPGK